MSTLQHYSGGRKTESLIVIVGTTASGKTALALEVAKRHNGEIICADSRTVYKHMNIGTAKPTREEQSEVRHHLIDVVEPGDRFTAADFQRLACRAISDILARGKLPIMAGGTGLYLDSILFDYKFSGDIDSRLRKELENLSVDELKIRCEESGISLPNNALNKRHLVRALEVGGINQQRSAKLRSETIVVGISIDNETLKQRIAERAQIMLSTGVLEEIHFLGEKYGWESQAMTGNIYRIFRRVALENYPIDLAVEEFVASDMQLAKRQRTWFKRNPDIVWSSSTDELIYKVDQFVANLNT